MAGAPDALGRESAAVKQLQDRNHAAARSPASLIDDLKGHPPVRRRFWHVAGFRQPGEHAADHAFAHFRRPGGIHHRNVHGHDIARRFLVADQFTADRHAIRRKFTKMHLKADPSRGRRLSDLRLEHGVGQGFCEQAALRDTEPLFRCGYRNDRHTAVPCAGSRTDYDIGLSS
jgi:hypothetical protein